MLKTTNRRTVILFFIILLGLFFRLIGILRPDGLWNDEMYSVIHAMKSFPFGIIQSVYTTDLQPPLYFSALHLWMKLFGNGDIGLIFYSVFMSLISIIVAYLTGKELLNYRTGIIAAFLISVNSFSIYYSQEVRPYAMLITLCMLSVLFLAKVNKKPTVRNYVCLVLANLAIVHTEAQSIMFVGIEVIGFYIYLYLNDRKALKGFIYSQAVMLALTLPHLVMLVKQYFSITAGQANGTYFAWKTTAAAIPAMFQTWFTPVLADMVDSPNYFNVRFNLDYILFFFIPISITFLGFYKTIKSNDKFIKMLLLIALTLFSFRFAIALSGMLFLCTRYLAPVFVLLLFCTAYGLGVMKKRLIANFIIFILIFLNIYFMITIPGSVNKKERGQNFNTIAEFLQKNKFNKSDYIFMPQGGNIIQRYYTGHANVVNYNINNLPEALKYTFGEESVKALLNKETARATLQERAVTDYVSPQFYKYFNNNVVKKIKSSHYLIIIFADYAYEDIDSLYSFAVTRPDSETWGYAVLYSKLLQDSLKISKNELRYKSFQKVGPWKIYVFEKREY